MKLRALLLLLILTAGMLAGCRQEQETSVIDTPEKAVESFAADVAAGDFNAAMQLCPADIMMEKFDSNLYSSTTLSDAENQTAETIKNDYAGQTAYFALTLLKGEISGPDPYDPEDKGWSADFLKDPNLVKLKDLTVLRIDKPYLADYDLEADSDVYRESMKNNTAVWGADVLTERIALFQHNGKTFMAGFTLIQYGGVWGIKSVACDFVDIPSPGGANQISEPDYLAYVKPLE